MVGQTVSHYRVLEKLGAGGMGVVYKAQDLKLDRLVALKFLPPHLSADLHQKHGLIQEAKAASALEHANIGVVHDIDETEDGQMFIILAYYDGETLSRRIERGLSSESAIDITIQILKALQAAHEHGITHRDIKPGNILITPDGVVKVIDFGLARMTDATVTLEGTTHGTIAYMSPEQVRGGRTDARTDIWAAGVVLYEMLAGRRPFGGDQGKVVMHSILEAEPEELRKLRPGVPASLQRIVRRALAKDREARYASAGEMEQDLDTLRSEALTRPRPWRWIAAAAVLLAAVTMLGWYLVREGRVRWAREEAIPQIQRLIEQDNYLAAFDLGREAEKRIPTDPGLKALWPQMSRTISIDTDPPGAEVFFKKYAAPETEWRRLGIAPLSNITVPQGFYEWKASKVAFEEFHGVAPTLVERAQFQLAPKGSVPPGMVKVPGGPFSASIAAFGPIGPFPLAEYFIDRYEVTNREFKQFVDRGGYRSREYWKEPIRKGGRALSWEQAMAEFHDATGRPGPATWEGGGYRGGEEDFPVTGVSWYEASAYAEFVGKKLPTVSHWYRASGAVTTPYIVPASNFGNKGLARVGQYPGISVAGVYDMAGNAREWCSNEAEDGLRFTLGGAWSDPPYQFTDPDARSPLDRSPANGFRCVRYTSVPAANAAGPMHKSFRDYFKEKPVSDELFSAYTSVYSFEPSNLKPAVDSVNDGSPYWRIEKVSFQAAYGNQRMFAYLFLPKGVPPPYHTLVFFPGRGVLYFRSSSGLAQGRGFDISTFDFVIRSGRALLYPVYQGSFERALPDPYPDAMLPRRERFVQWSQDIHRSIDYLATRRDIDLSQLAYYGQSLGGLLSAIMVPLEPRFKLAVLLDAGLGFRAALPEADPINFVSRIKIPVLMVNGRSDFTFPLETSQVPMFRVLGTPEKEKRHVVLDGAHGVLFYHRNEVVREVLAWLDKYAPIGRR